MVRADRWMENESVTHISPHGSRATQYLELKSVPKVVPIDVLPMVVYYFHR